MTNNELLQASLLDIVFEHRNKDYGAYALRRGYDRRLLTALALGLSTLFLFAFANKLNGGKRNTASVAAKKDSVVVRPLEIEQVKKKLPVSPDKPIEKPAVQKIVEPIAQIRFPPIQIVPDKLADPDPIATQDDLQDKQISDKNGTGAQYKGQVVENVPATASGTGASRPETSFLPEQANPEFPGGHEALMKFLARNLNTPTDLEPGEKRMVRAKFIVSEDGSVSLVEIASSGGEIFDREVMRVCRKMPRWKPAVQNGRRVAVSYLLPVTFIGMEQ